MINNSLNGIVNLGRNPLGESDFRKKCKAHLDQHGALVLSDFIFEDAIKSIRNDGIDNQHLAYYTANSHNIYLTLKDTDLADSHPYNRQINSLKGCITTDQIPARSVLHTLDNALEFKSFLG